MDPPRCCACPASDPRRRPPRKHGRSLRQSPSPQPLLPAWNLSRIPLHTLPSPTIQTRLAVNRPGDEYEQEADRISEQVMRMSSPVAAPSTRPTPAPRLQRKCGCGGTCAKCQADSHQDELKHLQRKSTPSTTPTPTTAPPIVSQVLNSPGQPLDPATRAFMEPRFNHDFSHVRVHTDARADQSARQLDAHAYTVAQNIVFAADQFAPATPRGQGLLAHELTHVLQQTAPASAREQPSPYTPAVTAQPLVIVTQPPPLGILQRDPADNSKDPWDNLNEMERPVAEEQYEEATSYIKHLSAAQQHHVSVLRSEWINTLSGLAVAVRSVDGSSKLWDIESAIPTYTAGIDRQALKFYDEWISVEKRYQGEHSWLLSRNVRSTDSIEAARYIEQIYGQTKRSIVQYVTDEDYADLKNVLDQGRHIWIGALRGARIRKKQLEQILHVVRDLRRDGEDPNQFVPQWSEQVDAEAQHLEEIARHADQASQGATDLPAKEASREWKVEFLESREDLLKQKQETLAVKSSKKSSLGPIGDAVGNVVDLVHGAVATVAGIFIEAGKEAIDLAQIGLYFESGGLLEPKFQSDMAAAAEQGASTGDLLMGMVTGMIETPSRFLAACKAGDWDAIGRETVNLYMLADTIRGIPEGIKKIPDAIDRVRELGEKLPRLIAETRDAMRILGAREATQALRSGSRLMPEVPRPSARLQAPSAPASTAPPAAPVHLTSPPDVAPPQTPAPPAPKVSPVRAVPDPPGMVRDPSPRPEEIWDRSPAMEAPLHPASPVSPLHLRPPPTPQPTRATLFEMKTFSNSNSADRNRRFR